MRPALLAATMAVLVTGMDARAAAASGYDLCAFTTQLLKSRAKDFGGLRGDMVQPGAVYDMKDGGAEYAITATPGEDAKCGILAAGIDNNDERVEARIFCSLGASRPLMEASELYVAELAQLQACFPRAKFEPSKYGDLAKPGDLVRWSTAMEERNFSLVLSMSTLPEMGHLPSNGQFTLRYQLWNMPGTAPARRPASAKAPKK